MERNCDKCIHHTSGMCSSWDCKMQTVEDVKREAREKAIEEFKEAVNFPKTMNLKPCPFCGGKNIAVGRTGYSLGVDIYVKCTDCRAKMQECEEFGEEAIIESWNTRKPEESVVAELERLRLKDTEMMEWAVKRLYHWMMRSKSSETVKRSKYGESSFGYGYAGKVHGLSL